MKMLFCSLLTEISFTSPVRAKDWRDLGKDLQSYDSRQLGRVLQVQLISVLGLDSHDAQLSALYPQLLTVQCYLLLLKLIFFSEKTIGRGNTKRSLLQSTPAKLNMSVTL